MFHHAFERWRDSEAERCLGYHEPPRPHEIPVVIKRSTPVGLELVLRCPPCGWQAIVRTP
jgi:hypothetical protein